MGKATQFLSAVGLATSLLLSFESFAQVVSCRTLVQTENLVTSTGPFHLEGRRFPTTFSEISDQAITRRDFSRLHPHVQPKDSLGIDLKQLVVNENRLVIGIEKRKHVFMVVGNTRFDGRLFHDPQTTAFSSELPVGKGLFAVLENVPSDVFSHLKRSIEEPANQSYLGCAHAVFSKLKEVGITPLNSSGMIVETSRAMEILTDGDLALRDGEMLRFRGYKTSDLDVIAFHSELVRYDQKVKSSIGTKFHGISPEAVVEMVRGSPKNISDEIKAFLSKLTGG